MWQVAWAHPMYGNILASCSYDRKVIIWKEENGTWEKTHEHAGHDSSGIVRAEGERGGPAGGRSCPGSRLPPGLGRFPVSLSIAEGRSSALKPVHSTTRKAKTT